MLKGMYYACKIVVLIYIVFGLYFVILDRLALPPKSRRMIQKWQFIHAGNSVFCTFLLR